MWNLILITLPEDVLSDDLIVVIPIEQISWSSAISPPKQTLLYLVILTDGVNILFPCLLQFCKWSLDKNLLLRVYIYIFVSAYLGVKKTQKSQNRMRNILFLMRYSAIILGPNIIIW